MSLSVTEDMSLIFFMHSNILPATYFTGIELGSGKQESGVFAWRLDLVGHVYILIEMYTEIIFTQILESQQQE